MAKDDGPTVSNIAKVKSVDENKATCVLIDEDGQEIFDVRLRQFSRVKFILVPDWGVMCWQFGLKTMTMIG
jgi:hypothetical protein